MVGVSLTLLVLAALGGTTMAVLRLRGAPYPPLVLAIGHGLLAAAGLACLAYAGNDQLGRYANGRPGAFLSLSRGTSHCFVNDPGAGAGGLGRGDDVLRLPYAEQAPADRVRSDCRP